MTERMLFLFSSSRSLKNVFWNLLGGFLCAILVVLATPWYVSRLGIEGYGIVGLWIMMQALMGMLDFGMGTTVIREFAQSSSDLAGNEYKRDLLRTLESFFWAIAILFILSLFFVAGWIGENWLKSSTLPINVIGKAIQLMAIALGLQFPSALYANGLAGLQKHGRMNALSILGNVLRYCGGIAVLFWQADLVWFFFVQALVSAIQTFVTRNVLWGMISNEKARPPAFRIKMLMQTWRFSMGMALSSIAAVLLANSDRIILSKMMPTEELGKYAVAFTATGLLQLGIQPFYRAYFPRYSELVSTLDLRRLHDVYFQSCKLMAVFVLSFGIIGWMFAPQLFNIWLGKSDKTIVDVFRILLIGIGCSGLMWLPAALQHAHGWASLHAAMIASALIVGAPIMVLAIMRFGTIGATSVWLLHGISDITLGLWLMHKRLLIGKLIDWYRSVLLLPLLICFPLAYLSWLLIPHNLSRWGNLFWIATTGVVVIATTFFLILILNWFSKSSSRHRSFFLENNHGKG